MVCFLCLQPTRQFCWFLLVRISYLEIKTLKRDCFFSWLSCICRLSCRRPLRRWDTHHGPNLLRLRSQCHLKGLRLGASAKTCNLPLESESNALIRLGRENLHQSSQSSSDIDQFHLQRKRRHDRRGNRQQHGLLPSLKEAVWLASC